MLKRIVIVFFSIMIALLSLSGCSEARPPENKKDYRFDYKARTMVTDGSTNILETDDSVFFLLNGFLYFSDKERKDLLPLCPRPDCHHDDADCDAYIDAFNFTAYGDHIYYVDGEMQVEQREQIRSHSLCCMQLDGTGHKKLLELPYSNAEFTYTIASMGTIFTDKYVIVHSAVADNMSEHIAYWDYIVDLETLELYDIEYSWVDFEFMGGLFAFAGRGDRLYCAVTDNTLFISEGIQTRYLCELNCATGELKKIGKMESEGYLHPEFSFFINDNEFLYYTYNNSANADERRVMLYSMSLADGSVKELMNEPVTQVSYLYFDWQNGLLFGDIRPVGGDVSPGLYFATPDFESVDRHIYSDEELEKVSKIMCFFQTESYFFGIGPNEYGAYGAANGVPEWYIDKADIGTGDLMWKMWGE